VRLGNTVRRSIAAVVILKVDPGGENNVLVRIEGGFEALGLGPGFRDDGFCEARDIPDVVEFVCRRSPVWSEFGDSLEKDRTFPSSVECACADSLDRNVVVEFIEDMKVARIARHVLCTACVVKPFFRSSRLSWRRLIVDCEDSCTLWRCCWELW